MTWERGSRHTSDPSHDKVNNFLATKGIKDTKNDGFFTVLFVPFVFFVAYPPPLLGNHLANFLLD
jgi:hypothetical protein